MHAWVRIPLLSLSFLPFCLCIILVFDAFNFPSLTSSSDTKLKPSFLFFNPSMCRFCCVITNGNEIAQCRQPDPKALELLFNKTSGGHWRWKNELVRGPKWSFTSPQADPCNDGNRAWQGIISSSPDVCKLQLCEIVSLTLDAYNLNGTLPSETFAQLNSLTYLEISSYHDLDGAIPSEIGSLSQLSALILHKNQLTGTLPTEFGCLIRLSALYLSENHLTGRIPTEIGSLIQLTTLHLYLNQFSGIIPSQIGSLSNLDSLFLYNNQLTGSIPSEIGSQNKLMTQEPYLVKSDPCLRCG
jgi:hypothetical protein